MPVLRHFVLECKVAENRHGSSITVQSGGEPATYILLNALLGIGIGRLCVCVCVCVQVCVCPLSMYTHQLTHRWQGLSIRRLRRCSPCPCPCPFFGQLLIFEWNDLWPTCLMYCFTLTLCRSSSKVKVIDRSWSHDEMFLFGYRCMLLHNVFLVACRGICVTIVYVTSSEGFLVSFPTIS